MLFNMFSLYLFGYLPTELPDCSVMQRSVRGRWFYRAVAHYLFYSSWDISHWEYARDISDDQCVPGHHCLRNKSPRFVTKFTVYTGWRTKCHTFDCTHNTFLLLQKHSTSGTGLILVGWKIVPNLSVCKEPTLYQSVHENLSWVATTLFVSA